MTPGPRQGFSKDLSVSNRKSAVSKWAHDKSPIGTNERFINEIFQCQRSTFQISKTTIDNVIFVLYLLSNFDHLTYNANDLSNIHFYQSENSHLTLTMSYLLVYII